MNNSVSSKLKTTALINGETVSYTISTLFSIFVLVALKQLFKTFIGLPVTASVLIAFIAAELVSFLLEKRFVFHKNVLSSNLKQILMFLFRAAVNFGFFKLSETIFGGILSLADHFYWLIAILIIFFFNYFFDRTLVFDCAYNAKSVRSSRIYKNFYANRFIAFSAFLAAGTISVVYMAYSIFPFGDSTVMRMDLYHQYGPLFAELYDRVVNHQSFLYSWTSGGGSSFLGNYFNYLSSPLSAVIFLFDKKNISFAISFLVSLKCIFSACSFTYYIKKSQKSHSYISAVFGVFYACSAYFLAYYWNVMWLDGMMLLPLIALGIENIINKGKGTVYIASLVLLFFSSYYMGFMSCIFSVFYFLVYYLISSNFTDVIDKNLVADNKYSFKVLNNNKFFNRGVRFAMSSIAAAGLCAFTLIPIFMILNNCSATSDSFPKSFDSYFNIFDFISSHLAGLETTIRSSGEDVLPNVYSGMLAVILLPLFIANKDIRTREKAGYVLLLLFFLFSFNNNCMNFIWHAFHFPNDLPFRFSYMYSFLLLVVGFKSISRLKSFEIKDIAFIAMAWIFFIIVAQKMSTSKMLEITIYTSLAFIILWTGYLFLAQKGKLKKTLMSVIAVLICFAETVVATGLGVHITQENKNYVKNYDTYTQAIATVEEDNDFFRQELSMLETRMDPCYYGYNGMSTFSSMAYEDYSQLQYSLGMFGNRINSYTYNTQTPIYNLMFNLKYLIHTDECIEPTDNIYTYKSTIVNSQVSVYQNNYFLPISYCVDPNIELWNTEEGNPFQIQGDFFELSTGYTDVFKEVDFVNTEFDGVSGDAITQNGTYWFYKENDDASYGYADIIITPKKSGNVYLYVSSPDISSIEISADKMISHTQQIDEPYILDAGYFNEGESLKISLDCGSSDVSECYADIYAYSLDEDVLEAGYRKLSAGALNVTSHTETSITGTIDVSENSCLYSSIPYDKGWSIYIDGEKAECFKIGSAMLGTSIKPGTHTVEYKYTPQGMNYGIAATVMTAAVLTVYVILTKKKLSQTRVEPNSLKYSV